MDGTISDKAKYVAEKIGLKKKPPKLSEQDVIVPKTKEEQFEGIPRAKEVKNPITKEILQQANKSVGDSLKDASHQNIRDSAISSPTTERSEVRGQNNQGRTH